MEGLEDTFKTLSIALRLQPSEPTYVLDVAQQPGTSSSTGLGSGLLAVSCSNRAIRLHSKDTLKLQREFQGHAGAVCGVRFAHSSPGLLYSGSADGTLRCWDVRAPGSDAVQTYRVDPGHSFCSFDLSCGDLLLCAGTEQAGEDSFLVFWDARMAKQGTVLGVYSESHSDDVTQVRFHPQAPDRLATGGSDGLVNVFDLSLGPEEEALLSTCNCGSSAATVCWAGKDFDQLLCLSHDESLHLWDVARPDSDDPLTLLTATDARSLVSLPDGTSLDYFVGGAWIEEPGKLLVVGGTSRGELHLLDCSGDGLSLVKSLKGGHSAVVRCFLWQPAGGGLLTGGEDGLLLQWKPGAEELESGKRVTLKSTSAMQLKSRSHRKHGTKRDKKQEVSH
ncbi:WD repeat-containing protein 89 [Denticeps clupeoides]|uniref:WD repeat-containing protein 89 n=1 Tax=Denticeps clupeoides TaxID=299321 RepID=A0AAY4B4I2_9TELE|nr:WD repeat-containing protein 89 [Denticeps clupeoides]XP_028848921.1 WD repeat-containing protein 89 [Denticeps clupeoides]